MTKYKVGDGIRWVETVGDVIEGDLGYVTCVRGPWVEVDTDGQRGKRFADAQSIEPATDPVNHPSHYTQYPVEVIEITERLSFLMGNVVKYVLRADHKGEPIQDLEKARWYLDREIARRKGA